MSHNLLVDQGPRDRFIQEVDRNFSVIAPAGVGKTQAVVERLVALAKSWQGEARGRVLVVTYTRKAAAEMEERVRVALSTLGAIGEFFLQNVFFGTLHSLAFRLLQEQALYLGLPTQLQLVEDEAVSWTQFERASVVPLQGSEEKAQILRRMLDLRSIWNTGKIWDPDVDAPSEAGLCPEVDLSPLYQYVPDRPTFKKGVEISQAILREWELAWLGGDLPCPIPEITAGGRPFIELAELCFAPLRNFLSKAATQWVHAIAKAYQAHRFSLGELLYADMVPLALRLLKTPEGRAKIASMRYHVIVDEAQDLDAEQFELLLGLAETEACNDGRFVMVGDPQQAIYGMRADLPTYLQVHGDLVARGIGEVLTLNVTFRCDQAIVACVNALFPQVLEPTKRSQVEFTPLVARPDCGLGQVARVVLQNPSAKKNDTWACVQAFANYLKDLNTADLGINDWQEAVCLCPRNDWLEALAEALQEEGIAYTLCSSRALWGDIPAHRWVLGLVAIVVNPQDAFEVAGVLRELFAIADSEIAAWVQAKKRISEKHPLAVGAQLSEGAVATALNQLYTMVQSTKCLPVRQGMEILLQVLDLRGRLDAIPVAHGLDHDLALDHLLYEVAQQEAQGGTWLDIYNCWARRMNESIERKPQPGAIQLMTCHGAKGLEWGAVFLPLMFKPIAFRRTAYPRVIQPEVNESARLQLEARDSDGAYETRLRYEQIAEQERLLYVAATRAKRTLVWIDDQAFFEESQGSFADYLGVLPGGFNEATWNALGSDIGIDVYNIEPVKPKPQPSISYRISKEINVWAQAFPRRQLPSSQVEEKIETQLFLKHADTGGADYGNAWHAMMEHMPWTEGRLAWESHMQACLPSFNNPNRARREQAAFLNTSLATILEKAAPSIRVEIPFLWKAKDNLVFEGTIDCIWWDESAGHGFILDWKTDQTENIEALAAHYAPQLRVYQEALIAQTGKGFNIMLYSTYLEKGSRIA